MGAVGHAGELRFISADLFGQKLHVRVGAESDNAVIGSKGLDHAKRIATDRAGGTQDGDAS